MTLKSFGFVSTIALVSALASPAYAQDQAKTQGDAAAAATTTTSANNAAQPANTDTNAANRTQEIVVTAEFRAARPAGHADRDHRGQRRDARGSRPDRRFADRRAGAERHAHARRGRTAASA